MPLPSVPIPINMRKPVLKALIIGIMYKDSQGEQLRTPHQDARDWRQLLIGESESSSASHHPSHFHRNLITGYLLIAAFPPEKYGFREENIVLMLDDDDIPEERQPNRKNIVCSYIPFISITILPTSPKRSSCKSTGSLRSPRPGIG